jgi:hypothetical protein
VLECANCCTSIYICVLYQHHHACCAFLFFTLLLYCHEWRCPNNTCTKNQPRRMSNNSHTANQHLYTARNALNIKHGRVGQFAGTTRFYNIITAPTTLLTPNTKRAIYATSQISRSQQQQLPTNIHTDIQHSLFQSPQQQAAQKTRLIIAPHVSHKHQSQHHM